MCISICSALLIYICTVTASTTQAPLPVGGELNEVEIIVIACVGSALGVVLLVALSCYCTREKKPKQHGQPQQPNGNIPTGNGSSHGALNSSADFRDEITVEQNRNLNQNHTVTSFRPTENRPSLNENTITPRDMQPAGRTLPEPYEDQKSNLTGDFPESTDL